MLRTGAPLIRLGTKCATLDELVTRFAPFTTETTLTIPAGSDAKAGATGRLVIQLADKTEVLKGRCLIEEVKPSGEGRSLMRLRLLDMDEQSRKVHRRFLAARRIPPPVPLAAAKPPPFRPAMTLIGTPAPPVEPATVRSLAPVPLAIAPDTIESTERNRFLGEARAEGAAFTLPANPLSELGPSDLASFIECTLFEASGEEGGAEGEAVASPEAPPEPSAAPEPQAPAPSPVAVAAVESVVSLVPAYVPPTPTAALRLLPPLRRRIVQAAPYALCTVVGVLVGSLQRGSPPAPVAPPIVPAAQAAPAPVVVAPPPAPAAAPAPAADEGEGSQPEPASGCVASVSTEPDGAVVMWGTVNLGRTPVRAAPVACGEATVTLRHERYREVSRRITAEPGAATDVTERLRRPMATLQLSATAPRATFTLDQQPLGAGPKNVNVMRFEHHELTATAPGYHPWTQTLYVREPSTKVVAPLVAIKPPPRAAARPAPRPAGLPPVPLNVNAPRSP